MPAAPANAPFEASRDFTIDKNNVAPRVGLVWTVGSDRRTVVRVNSGLMYDQAILASYEQTLINDGTNARAASTFQPATPGAPAFPNVLSAGAGATPNTLTTVSPDFKVARNWQKIERPSRLSDRTDIFLHVDAQDEVALANGARVRPKLILRCVDNTTSAMISGDGLLWSKPLPTAPVRISYGTWLHRGDKLATLDLLDEFANEMQKIPAGSKKK